MNDVLENIIIKKDKGEVLFFPGDAADICYIVKKGQIEIFVYDKDGNSIVIDVMREGDIIGDMALIMNSDRTAGARAVVTSELYCLTKRSLMEIIKKRPEFAVKLMLVFRERLKNINNKVFSLKIKKNLKFKDMESYQEVIKSSRRLFKKGTIIFREFEKGKIGFVIKRGSVRLVKLNPILHQETELAVLGVGEIFGELSLLGSHQRIATAISDSDDTELIIYDEERFQNMIYHDIDFAMKVLKICCSRIKNMNEKVRKI